MCEGSLYCADLTGPGLAIDSYVVFNGNYCFVRRAASDTISLWNYLMLNEGTYCREPPHMGLRDYGGGRTDKRRAR